MRLVSPELPHRNQSRSQRQRQASDIGLIPNPRSYTESEALQCPAKLIEVDGQGRVSTLRCRVNVFLIFERSGEGVRAVRQLSCDAVHPESVEAYRYTGLRFARLNETVNITQRHEDGSGVEHRRLNCVRQGGVGPGSKQLLIALM